MATTKSISRGSGQSAVASASYRAGEKLQDERYGKTQDYSKRQGVMSANIILPSELKDKVEIDRNTLWNMAERAENRKDSRVAREWIINLPHELDEETRKALAHRFAQSLADKYGVIADCCIHRPTEKEIARGADERNFHAHIMLTTRQAQLTADNQLTLGDKATIELSDNKRRSIGLDRVSNEIVELRELWERTANEQLAEHGYALIDSRSYQSQGIDQLPQLKMGKNATQMERDGIQTPVGDLNRLIKERNELVFNRELADIKRTNQLADRIIVESRKNQNAIERTETSVQPSQENLATYVPPDQEKSIQRENRPPSVDFNLSMSQIEPSQETTPQDLMAKYEQWKSQNKTKPSDLLKDIEQSAMSKYEQWKAEKAIVEQQAQLQAERQRQLEQDQAKIRPDYDNEIGFSP
ncbi:MobA/MobL family protein (plasmid) [Moraxella osloensis]|uniref:MobA/MobL family protein n=1 Tax=uncultured Psychrobacter sp. TaxID=259303 RepID=UPI001951EFE1|nr:MobA/MobL family protein [Moraxella osloensis]QRO12242.1 MobA/MobL family protein [Moraxella osloensis]